MEFDGAIVILSYPDTVVRPAYSEFSSKVWPKLGIGSENAIQAGHAAMLLIDKTTKNVDYFDFGRYITSYGNGRVRSKETDPELTMPFAAKLQNNKLVNLKEMLLWLDANPHKTHGEGRLVASVNNKIDYKKALVYINNLLEKKEVPYGAFVKNGTNCARFVTDAIIQACGDKSVVLKLKTSNLLTPSPIGNAIKGTTEEDIYVVENKQVNDYVNRSVVKEYGACFLNKFEHGLDLIGTELPDKDLFYLEDGTWLGGIGSGAWFNIEAKEEVNLYKIARYTVKGEKDFEGVFKIKDFSFDIEESYEFVHPTNCLEVFIEQGDKEFKLVKV
ncbi:DUF6695 family protein [Wenyingzhuangia sp. IMCC45467]